MQPGPRCTASQLCLTNACILSRSSKDARQARHAGHQRPIGCPEHLIGCSVEPIGADAVYPKFGPRTNEKSTKYPILCFLSGPRASCHFTLASCRAHFSAGPRPGAASTESASAATSSESARSAGRFPCQPVAEFNGFPATGPAAHHSNSGDAGRCAGHRQGQLRAPGCRLAEG